MVSEARASGRGSMLLLELLKFIPVFFAASLVMELCGSGAARLLGLNMQDEQIGLLVMLYEQIVGIAVVLLYCRFLEKRPISSVGFRRKRWLSQYLLGLAVGFGMFSLVVLLGWALGGFTFEGTSGQLQPGMLLLFLAGYMVQGMFEEVISRGYLMISMARKSPVWLAVLVNAVGFSLLHALNPGYGPLPAVNLFLFGAFASVYILKSGNIWGAGAIHAIWNFAQGCFYGLSVSGMPLTQTVLQFSGTDRTWISGGAFGPEGGICVTLVCGLGLALLLRPGGNSEK